MKVAKVLTKRREECYKIMKKKDPQFRVLEDFERGCSTFCDNVSRSAEDVKLYRYMAPPEINDKEMREFSEIIKNKMRKYFTKNSSRYVEKFIRYAKRKIHDQILDEFVQNTLSSTIRLSDLSKMNDIYEGLSKSVDIKGMSVDELNKLGRTCRIRSFTECCNNSLMWAHYADGCRGICVEYDLKTMVKEDNKKDPVLRYLFPVCYEESKENMEIKAMVEEVEKLEECIAKKEEFDPGVQITDNMDIWLRKSPKWEYEKEWRLCYPRALVYHEQNEDKEFVEFPCISAVYLGARIDSRLEKKIRKQIKDMNLPIEVKMQPIDIC